jgi:hypothetical protein
MILLATCTTAALFTVTMFVLGPSKFALKFENEYTTLSFLAAAIAAVVIVAFWFLKNDALIQPAPVRIEQPAPVPVQQPPAARVRPPPVVPVPQPPVPPPPVAPVDQLAPTGPHPPSPRQRNGGPRWSYEHQRTTHHNGAHFERADRVQVNNNNYARPEDPHAATNYASFLDGI